MPSVAAYHRPRSLDEAAQLLVADGRERRAIGGGTVVVPAVRADVGANVEVVDLQDLPLAGVELVSESTGEGAGRLRIGAMVRLAELADGTHRHVPPLLAESARRELPSTIRTQATVGGTVALGDPDSVLTAALLVHGAVVELHGHDPLPLQRSLPECVGRRLVTAVTVETGGVTAWAATARTPADIPIVAAVARRSDRDGAAPTVALTGVGPYPILVDDLADPTAGLDVPGDFRGSTDYRRHLAATLVDRAVGQLEDAR